MGILIGLTIMLLWLGHLVFALAYAPDPALFFTSWPSALRLVFHVAVQGYLFTGLFITAHDAMHGTVARRLAANTLIGNIATFLFAGLSYLKLIRKHRLHHLYPGSGNDPDYYTGRQHFWTWWFSFMRQYVTIWQLVIMAVLFNVLAIWIDKPSLVVYWIVPSLLSTLQLFYFGTYLPHREPHTEEMTRHHARTQKKNHLWAMLSCYFFGYHLEHHLSPGTPWWKLYSAKDS